MVIFCSGADWAHNPQAARSVITNVRRIMTSRFYRNRWGNRSASSANLRRPQNRDWSAALTGAVNNRAQVALHETAGTRFVSFTWQSVKIVIHSRSLLLIILGILLDLPLSKRRSKSG